MTEAPRPTAPGPILGRLEAVRGPLRRAVVAAPPPRRRRGVVAEPVTLLSVYRTRNEAVLRRLLDRCPRASVRLWCLDDRPAASLSDLTIGCGQGARWDLLGRLAAHAPIPADHWVAVADDDVVFLAGDLPRVTAIARRSGFALAQPAHSRISVHTHTVTVAQPLVRSRETHFVEIGPLFVIAPEQRGQFLPFPAELGMGWGTEVLWEGVRRRHGLRFGVVDAAKIVHVGRVASGYGTEALERQLGELLAEAGLSRVSELTQYERRWWRWQARPPWLDGLADRRVR